MKPMLSSFAIKAATFLYIHIRPARSIDKKIILCRIEPHNKILPNQGHRFQIMIEEKLIDPVS